MDSRGANVTPRNNACEAGELNSSLDIDVDCDYVIPLFFVFIKMRGASKHKNILNVVLMDLQVTV